MPIEMLVECLPGLHHPQMSNVRTQALAAIEAYLTATGTAAWALGLAACHCDKVIPRIRSGANVGLRTIEAIENFMVAHPDGIRLQRPRTAAKA